MLGVIFTGGESPPSWFVKQELEGKEAFIIAADSGLIAAENSGIKPDCIIGDMDSIDDSRLSVYLNICIIRHKKDKDYTDTELAFQEAVKKGCKEIWILGGGGGRIDHLFAIRSLFERDLYPHRWITDNADIRCVEGSIQVTGQKGALVSVFPLGNGPWQAQSGGLKWQLDGLPWDRGFFGISNIAADGDFFINAEKGRFMLILPLPL